MASTSLFFDIYGRDHGVTDTFDRIGNKGKGLSSVMAGVGGAIGGIVGGVVLGGLSKLGSLLTTGVQEAMDASAAQAQLAAGIQSTGNAANVSLGGLNDLASAIQAYSGQTDDSIAQTEALLLTFTNIKNQGPDKIFDQATMAAADMAAKFGGDASSQAIVLGKALNDPVAGLSALRRVGIQFTDSQEAQIKAMVAAGDVMGAQKLILSELNVEFGGAAKAAGESLPGQIQRGKRAFEDLSQTIVEKITPVIGPVIENVIHWITDLTASFSGAGGGASGFVAQLMPMAVAFFQVITAVNPFHIIMQAIVPLLPQLGGLFSALGGAVVALFQAFAPLIPMIMSLVSAVIPPLQAVFMALIPVVMMVIQQAIMPLIQFLGSVLPPIIQALLPIVSAVFTAVAAIITAAMQIVQGIINVVLGVINGNWSQVWTGLQQIVAGVGAAIAAIINGLFNVLRSIVSGGLAAIAAFFSSTWSNVVSGVSGFISGVIGTVSQLPGRILGALGSLGGLLIGVGRDMIAGLARGISGAAGMIFDAVRGAVGNVVDFAKKILGIGSPSKVMAMEVGRWIPPGIAQGITGAMPVISRAMAAVGRTVTDFSPTMGFSAGVSVGGTNPRGAISVGASGGGSGFNLDGYEMRLNADMTKATFSRMAGAAADGAVDNANDDIYRGKAR